MAIGETEPMKPLGALDALFLHLETADTPMHVGALHLLDAPADDHDFFATVGRHIDARLGSELHERLAHLSRVAGGADRLAARPQAAHQLLRSSGLSRPEIRAGRALA